MLRCGSIQNTLIAGESISENVADAALLLIKNDLEKDTIHLYSATDIRGNSQFGTGRFLAIVPR